jgi:YhcH/YjgK/YiaL family protein
MAIIGSIATVREQAPKHPSFNTTFAYLDEVLRPGTEANKRLMSVGIGESKRIELGGGIFALEQSYNTKARHEGKWESHLKFIDVQVIVSGEEIMELNDISALSVSENLTPAKDLIFYKEYDNGSPIRLKAGEAAILFPPDGHKPGVKVKNPVQVHKIVVKVPVL